VRRLAAALALLAAVPAAGQPPAAGPTSIPAELLAPSEEARAAFDALASRPLTDDVMEATIQAQPVGSMRPMDDIIERTLAGGEAVNDWQNLGVDERAMIAEHDGGLAENMIEGTNQFGPTFGYYVDRPIEVLIPPEWVLVGRRGRPFTAENIEIGISRVSPKVILVERIAYLRRGSATCRGQTESRLYADPAIPAGQIDIVTVAFSMRFLAAVERRGMCRVLQSAGQNLYRARLFDSGGHPFSALDQGIGQFRIVPFRPVLGRAAGQ
jgi:hypothetical protein